MVKVAGQATEKVGSLSRLQRLAAHVAPHSLTTVGGARAPQTKNALRSVRKQGLDQLKKLKGSVSDDDLFRYQKQVGTGRLQHA